MANANHTPGPWYTCPAADFDRLHGPVGHHGLTAVFVPPVQTPHPGDSDDWPTLVAYADDYRGDARLIAAAPDLLAACVAVVETDGFVGSGLMRKRIADMKAAIEKATRSQGGGR